MNTIEKRKRIEQLTAELGQLRDEVAREERQCRHARWSDTEYDPIIEPNMVFDGYKGVGSDPQMRMKRSGDKTTPRWKRTCLDCGKVEHTEKRKTTATAPDFG